MKRLLILLFAVGLAVNGWADSYRDALVKYLQQGKMVDPKEYEQMILPMAELLYPDDAANGYKAFADYFSSQVMYDIADIFRPSFEKFVSEKELKKLSAALRDPKIMEIQSRTNEIMDALKTSDEFTHFLELYQLALKVILYGGDMPDDIARPDDVSEQYELAFRNYYQTSGVGAIIESTFRYMADQLLTSLREMSENDPEPFVDKLVQYTNRNLPMVLMTVYSKAITLEDLNTLETLNATPAYQHAVEALKDSYQNPMEIGIAVITRMAEWMHLHHPQYAAPLQQQLQNLQLLLK